MKIVTLMGAENEKLFSLRRATNQLKADILAKMDKPVVSRADVEVEASEEYESFRIQKAKVEQYYEFINVAKAQARVLSDEIRSN